MYCIESILITKRQEMQTYPFSPLVPVLKGGRPSDQISRSGSIGFHFLDLLGANKTGFGP